MSFEFPIHVAVDVDYTQSVVAELSSFWAWAALSQAAQVYSWSCQNPKLLVISFCHMTGLVHISETGAELLTLSDKFIYCSACLAPNCQVNPYKSVNHQK